MPADDRVPPARVGVPQVLVGVAQPGVGHLDQHLARARVEDLELDDLVLGLRLPQHRCSGSHPPMLPAAADRPAARPLGPRPGRPGAAPIGGCPPLPARAHRASVPGCGAVLVHRSPTRAVAPRRLPLLRPAVRGDAARAARGGGRPTPPPPRSSRLADAAYDAQHPVAGEPDRTAAALARLAEALGAAGVPAGGPRPPDVADDDRRCGRRPRRHRPAGARRVLGARRAPGLVRRGSARVADVPGLTSRAYDHVSCA